ncbi:unnamed protein product [Mycena citricolor]|uniref:Rhamnogalacturonan acetylesterase n=1 Tax=Mycena citricolor TaxID=2018698 RepID=A0AAD2HN57_9AGAR|nr:unnamed protein product [Mycena citricolor]
MMIAQTFTSLILASASLVSAQTVYLAGDSTMARGGGGGSTNGWGEYLGQLLTLPVVNKAVAGRSARSYTEEGRFTTLLGSVKSGDFVVLEFGHNDGSSGIKDNGREDAYGDSLTATTVVDESDGSTHVIHTFNYYMTNATKAFQAKGAHVILASQTPDDYWNSANTAIGPPPRFVPYMKEVAGNTTASYVDHYAYVAQAYGKIGQKTVVTYFPQDHTHTSVAGATVVAEAFVRGLLCGSSTLKTHVNAAGKAVPNGCI